MKKPKTAYVFLSIILAISMLGTVVNAIEATEMENKSLNNRTMYSDSDDLVMNISTENEHNQIVINEMFSDLLENSANFYSDNVDNNLFPNNYAGSYYSFSDEKLYMCKTDDEMDDFYKSHFESPLIELTTVNYSITYLESILDELTEEVFNNLGIAHASLNIENNCVLIDVTNLDNRNTIDEYYNSLGYDIQAIRYRLISEMETVSTSSYNESGRKIYAKDVNIDPGTIGCTALRVYNGKSYRGIITCAHVIENYPNLKWEVVTDTNGARTELLNPQSSALISKNNTKVDAVFVPYTDQSIENTPYLWNYHGTNIYQGKIVSYSSSLTNYENQIITKYGVSGELQGTLMEVTSVGTIGGKYRNDFFKISAHSYFGDSGGPVGVKSTSNGHNYFNILGFTTAMYRPAGSDAQSGPAFCDKIENVKNELDVFPVSGNAYPY